MPELPEVETVCVGLAPYFDGVRITQVEQRRANLRWPFPQNFPARLRGASVTRLSRRGKYILAPLDTGETLLMHLGMSGKFTVAAPGPGASGHNSAGTGPHDHVVFHFASGARVTFTDPRRFGLMDLFDSSAPAGHRLLANLGPEPLEAGFDAAYLAQAFSTRKMPLKSILLDQRVVAGLGNIYVCEVLHLAQLSPLRQAQTLGTKRQAKRLGRLVEAIQTVLRRAIAAGGSTIRDFATAEGGQGYFQHNFAVYGHGGEPCERQGCKGTISRIVQSGRSTFFCPACQT
ncbi:MAG: bifunctional DNA-formamidopyrimidine glycosylase/DNA-(apurinic or apyrimidinic site) lyase [Alphaproteobacteria bacterium]